MLNKASGVAVHPGPGHYNDTIGNFVLHYYDSRSEEGDFHPVHRLDRGTSGLMVVARHPHAQEILKRQLHTADFHRTYLAVCEGAPEPPAGTVDAPLGPREGSLVEQCVRPDGKPAAGISRHARQVPLLKASPSLLEQRVDQFALALEALRQRRKRLPQVLVFRFKFRAPDFPQRRGRLIHGVQFGFQAVAFVPERGVFLRKRTPALFRLLHAAARSRFALLQQPDTVGLLLVLAFQFNDKPPARTVPAREPLEEENEIT